MKKEHEEYLSSIEWEGKLPKEVKLPTKPFSGVKEIYGPVQLYRGVPLCVAFTLQWNQERNALSVIPGVCIKSAEFSDNIYDEFHFLWTWLPDIAFNTLEIPSTDKSQEQLAADSGLIDYMRFIDWILDSTEDGFKKSLMGMMPKLLRLQKEAKRIVSESGHSE